MLHSGQTPVLLRLTSSCCTSSDSVCSNVVDRESAAVVISALQYLCDCPMYRVLCCVCHSQGVYIPFQTNNALQVYLHVDLTYYPAVRMYETMGYEVVNDLEISFEVRAMLG